MNKHSGRPNKHSGLDKYYSKPQVAENITRILKAYILENKLENTFDQIVEPSGGDGAFVGPLKGFCKPVDAFDIAPEHPLVREKDFFEFTCSAPTLYVGNPPFGHCANLAVKFFIATFKILIDGIGSIKYVDAFRGFNP